METGNEAANAIARNGTDASQRSKITKAEIKEAMDSTTEEAAGFDLAKSRTRQTGPEVRAGPQGNTRKQQLLCHSPGGTENAGKQDREGYTSPISRTADQL